MGAPPINFTTMAGNKSYQPYRNPKTGIRMLFPGGENFGTGSFDRLQRMHHGQLDVKIFPKIIKHENIFKVFNGKIIAQATLSEVKSFPVLFYEN